MLTLCFIPGLCKMEGLARTPLMGWVPLGDTQLCALFLPLQMGCYGFLSSFLKQHALFCKEEPISPLHPTHP